MNDLESLFHAIDDYRVIVGSFVPSYRKEVKKKSGMNDLIRRHRRFSIHPAATPAAYTRHSSLRCLLTNDTLYQSEGLI